MRVLLVSLFRPSRHNLHGPSALPYYLAKYRPAHIKLDLLYYDRKATPAGEETEELAEIFSETGTAQRRSQLSVLTHKVIQRSRLVPALKGLDLAYRPTMGDLNRISQKQYDLIWIYPNILFPWYRKLDYKNIVMTGPDCSLLHYQLLKHYLETDPSLFPASLPQVRSFEGYFARSYSLEKAWGNSSARLHVVGKEDKKVYDELSPNSHCFFAWHPVSEYGTRRERIDDSNGKLTILVSGANNGIYIGNLLDRLAGSILSAELAGLYRFLIIGSNFEGLVQKLTGAGYEVEHHRWVEDYSATICSAHIQLFPIALGTGTKGKVLSALATGLLCIGTEHAFENIRIDVTTDCLLLGPDAELKGILTAIWMDKRGYAEMADRAMRKVRLHHAPESTSDAFWKNVLKELK